MKRKIIYLLYAISYIIFLWIFIVGNKAFIEAKRNTDAIRRNTEAIQQAVKDITTDNQQKLDLLICMALVPQDERTTDTVNHCREKTNTTEAQMQSWGHSGPEIATPPQSANNGGQNNNPSNNGDNGQKPKDCIINIRGIHLICN